MSIELCELVFEEVKQEAVLKLAQDIDLSLRADDEQALQIRSLINGKLNDQVYYEVVNPRECFSNFSEIFLRIIEYGGKFDLEINWAFSDSDRNHLAEVCAYAMKVMQSKLIGRFYCGLEPADDEQNQFFSNIKPLDLI